ncbi:AraC family transcriptional regulator [Lentilactobacillus sp. Marseille-Q4993]|uniref:helix-turn-helix domain-containing protein n=1 Tax=Lentilactobacillus sp. Marseille-Q4993 TaxID=3039492 RepID=UPI0024BC4DF0|nr:AraC family transcriptional regulator [Lentilactobacillus sp. Marseille-Q4993]
MPRFFDLDEPYRIMGLFTELLDIAHRPGHKTATDYSTMILICEIAADFQQQQKKDDIINTRVSQIKEWIRLNMNKELKVGDIANQFEVSQNYLSQSFHRETGITVKDYLNTLKLDKAKYLLLTTNLSIQEITDQSYFSDYKYFFRLFKKKNGMTPREYRNTFTNTFLNNPDIDPGYDIGKIVSILERGVNRNELFD